MAPRAPLTFDRFHARNLVRAWLSDESRRGSHLVKMAECKAKLVLESSGSGLFAGGPFAELIFKELDCSCEWHISDGEKYDDATKIVSVVGNLGDLMCCEQLVTLVLSRACAIATQTEHFQRALSDSPWRGNLCVSPSRTPGFGLLEEYAMLVAGAEAFSPSLMLRRSLVLLHGGVEKTIKSIGSKRKEAVVAVECTTWLEASNAGSSGASIIVLANLDIETINSISKQLKKVHPHVSIHVTGEFDEEDLKDLPLDNIDSLATSKLIAGSISKRFCVSYDRSFSVEDTLPVTASPELKRPKSASPQAPEVDVPSTSSSPVSKQPRLADDADQQTPERSPSAFTKPNGVSNRPSNQFNTYSTSATTRGAGSKLRGQRNKMMSQQHAQLKQGPLLSHASMGSASPSNRFMSPGIVGVRAQNPFQNMNNPGMMGPPNPSPPNARSQSNQPRPGGQGMLGNSPSLMANFLGLQTGGTKQATNSGGGGGGHSPSNFSNMTGPLMGTFSPFGMRPRMQSASGFATCRGCGVANGPGLAFCRNCRSPLR